MLGKLKARGGQKFMVERSKNWWRTDEQDEGVVVLDAHSHEQAIVEHGGQLGVGQRQGPQAQVGRGVAHGTQHKLDGVDHLQGAQMLSNFYQKSHSRVLKQSSVRHGFLDNGHVHWSLAQMQEQSAGKVLSQTLCANPKVQGIMICWSMPPGSRGLIKTGCHLGKNQTVSCKNTDCMADPKVTFQESLLPPLLLCT